MQTTDEHTQNEEQAQPLEGTPEAAVEQNGKDAKKHKWLPRILGGDVLQSRAVLKQVPLILLICVYAIVLVYNRYQVESLTSEKQEAQQRINYLREERIDMQKRFQETIKISQIAEMLDTTGIGITAEPPYELYVD